MGLSADCSIKTNKEKKRAERNSRRLVEREAKRKAGVPTSRGNIGVQRDSSIPSTAYKGGNNKDSSYPQNFYENSNGKTVVTSTHPKDKKHANPHVHLNEPKGTDRGKYTTFSNGAVKYKSGGVTVEY